MKPSLVIGVDVDDVCADLITSWLARYNAEFEDNLVRDQIRRWEIATYAKPECSHDKFFSYLTPDIYDQIDPFPGALTAVERLREIGRVVFVTAGNADAKLAWLQRHGFLTPGFMHKDFISATDKTLITGAHVLIDDHIKNVEAFPNFAILVNQPHNTDLPCSRARVPSIGDAAELLHRYRKVLG